MLKQVFLKKDNQSYLFECINKDDMPDNLLKSDWLGKKRTRFLTDEEKLLNKKKFTNKWSQITFTCSCGKNY